MAGDKKNKKSKPGSSKNKDEPMDDKEFTPKSEVYLPSRPLKKDEELVCDESAYIMLHEANAGSPCLSFDVIRDDFGENRDAFPLTAYIVAGSQSERTQANNIFVMCLSNMKKTQKLEAKDDSSDESDSDDDEDKADKPNMSCARIKHNGCVNRLRSTVHGGKVLAASWSELGNVNVWNLTTQLRAVEDPTLLTKYNRNGLETSTQPLYTFSGHQMEGFALDWCPTESGMLVSGDCKQDIHVWRPTDSGSWQVDQRPLVGHTDSVEDLQWSPNERHVLASCSVDKSICIWDVRTGKAPMLSVAEAHESDVNVITWNRNEPFIASGGDDGVLHVWDLRQLKSKDSAVVTFKHHTGAITSVEWHPTEVTVFASAGQDDQIAMWDLSLERDDESEELKDLPPQLLFIHQGQKDLKELHWHPQLTGVLISTALSGFNIFRTISL